MFLVKLFSFTVIITFIAGCSKLDDGCTSIEAKKLVSDIVVEAAEKTLIAQTNESGQLMFDSAKVRATLSLFSVNIDDIRTTKNDPNSTKKFCAATLKVSIPSEIFNEVIKTREKIKAETLVQHASGLGFESSANSFNKSIEYNVQPTDDKKNVFVELEGATNLAKLLDEVVATVLIKPIIENADASRKQAEAAQMMQQEEEAELQVVQQQELEEQQNQQKQANLDLVKEKNNVARQGINELWGLMPEAKKSLLLDEQRAWVKKKEIDCKVEASTTTTDPLEKEVALLSCDTNHTIQRIEMLKQHLGV